MLRPLPRHTPRKILPRCNARCRDGHRCQATAGLCVHHKQKTSPPLRGPRWKRFPRPPKRGEPEVVRAESAERMRAYNAKQARARAAEAAEEARRQEAEEARVRATRAPRVIRRTGGDGW